MKRRLLLSGRIRSSLGEAATRLRLAKSSQLFRHFLEHALKPRLIAGHAVDIVVGPDDRRGTSVVLEPLRDRAFALAELDGAQAGTAVVWKQSAVCRMGLR